MTDAFAKFPTLAPNEAYQGDLCEHFHAIVNQRIFVEICSMSNDARGEHHVGHIAELSENVYDLSEFQHSYRGGGTYYHLATEADMREFLVEVTKLMVFERP